MIDWISKYSSLISAIASVGMLVVWIVYLQIFVTSYRRQRRAKIVVNHGAGAGLDARCLVCNMSAEPIYVESIIVSLTAPEATLTGPVTDISSQAEREALPGYSLQTRQGPLGSGQVIDMGSFRNLVDRVVAEHGARPELLASLREVEITVAAIHGSDDLVVGASRKFAIDHRDGCLRLTSETITTRPITSRRERRRLAKVINTGC